MRVLATTVALLGLLTACRDGVVEVVGDAAVDATPRIADLVQKARSPAEPDVVFSVDLVGTTKRFNEPATLLRLKQDAPYPYRKLGIEPETKQFWVQANDCPPSRMETWPEMTDVWTDDAGGFVAVGTSGRIVMKRGDSWACWIGTGAYTAVSGSSWGNVVVAQSNGLLHFDGRKWSLVDGIPATVKDVWAGKGVVWAATSSGHILKMDREWITTWKLATDDELATVWGASPDDLWVAGGYNLLHYDGATWTRVATGLEGKLLQVEGAQGKSPWVRTDRSEVARFDGTSFIAIEPLEGTIEAFHVTPENTPYAVREGQYGSTLFRWTGEEWKEEKEHRIYDSVHAIHGSRENGLALLHTFELEYGQWDWDGFSGHTIWGTAEDDIWSIGSNGVITHFDGKRWEKIPSPTEAHLRDVHGVDASCAWIVGDGVALQWNGWKWLEKKVPDNRDLDKLHVLSCDHFFAVGPSDVVLEYENGRWTEHVLGMPIMLRSVWGLSATDVWVVGDQGVIMHWDGTSWTPEQSGAGDTLHDIAGLPTGEIWVVGDHESSDGLFQRTESGWKKVANASGHRLFVLDAEHVYVSTTWWELSWSGAHVWMWNGKKIVDTSVITSEPYDEDGPYLASVWGTSPGRLWCAGDTLYHFFRSKDAPAQKRWHPEELSLLDCELEKPTKGKWKIAKPTSWNLHAVWGDSNDRMWAVGDAGTILHYDGENWIVQTSGTKQRLDVVWGFGPDDVWAAGAQGTILQFDGNGWKMAPSPTSDPITAVAPASSTSVWIGTGAGGVFHHDGNAWTAASVGVDKPITAMHEAADGVLWLTTSKRIVTWDGEKATDILIDPEYGDQWISGLAGAGKHVWVADSMDVWSFRKGKKKRLSNYEGAVENADISSMAGTSPKNLWYTATPGAGCIMTLMASSICHHDVECYWCDELPLMNDVHPFPSGHVVAVGMEGVVVWTE